MWPVDYEAESLRRLNLLRKLNNDPDLRAAFMVHYSTHPIDWINDWCVTQDPRNVGSKIVPMVLFTKQEEFIEFLNGCLTDKENGLVEKCRDVGATWGAVYFTVWTWLFNSGSMIGWGSRKEEYVDKRGDPKAIFPKLRQVLLYLPPWMLPRHFDLDTHSPYMRVLNPENGATITGEAGLSQGRGGRTTFYIKDESAHYENPEMIEAALGDNTDVQIDISSVNGTGNVFHRKRMAGELWFPGCTPTPGKTRVFIFDWRDHPGKTQEWYDMRRSRAEDEGLLHLFAQEVDRDYAASVEGIIIPAAWVEAAVDAHKVLNINIEGLKIAGQDIADGGGDKNALVIRHGILCQYAAHWGGEANEAAQRAIPICNEYGVSEIYYDSIGVGAAFRTECDNLKKQESWNSNMRVLAWNAGGAVLDPDKPSIKGDSKSVLNKDQYKNLKAQAWYRLRTRFSKTFRAVRHKESFEPDELVSIDSTIPLLHQLKMELSQPVRKQNDVGKFTVDKKPEGTASPNLADAFVQCYNPVRKISSFDAV